MNTACETQTEWTLACEAFMTPENLGAWFESARTDKQPSSYFGMISNAELIGLLFGGKANTEQMQHAFTSLRTRFISENSELIALEADQIRQL